MLYIYILHLYLIARNISSTSWYKINFDYIDILELYESRYKHAYWGTVDGKYKLITWIVNSYLNCSVKDEIAGGFSLGYGSSVDICRMILVLFQFRKFLSSEKSTS